MSRYSRVDERFWDDETLRAVSEDARFLYLYLLTCKHRNRLGLYVLDDLYAASDLAWETDRARSAREELESHNRIEYDPATRVVYLPRFLEYNRLENRNVVKGTLGDLARLPRNPFFEDLLARLEEGDESGFYGPLLSALRDRIATARMDKGLRNRSGNGYPNPIETHTETQSQNQSHNQDQNPENTPSPNRRDPRARAPTREAPPARNSPKGKVETNPKATDSEIRHAAIHRLGLGRYVSAKDQARVSKECHEFSRQVADPLRRLEAIEGAARLRDEGLVGLKKGEPYSPGIFWRFNRVWYGEGDSRTERTLIDAAIEHFRKTEEGSKRRRGSADLAGIGDLIAKAAGG